VSVRHSALLRTAPKNREPVDLKLPSHIEAFSPEGPKVIRHNDWFYLITAVGGTAGLPPGHMVIAARSRSIHGPWENAPGNPLVRTQVSVEKWRSRGHATVFEGPNNTWWMIYHGYENGLPDTRPPDAAGSHRMDGGPLVRGQGRRSVAPLGKTNSTSQTTVSCAMVAMACAPPRIEPCAEKGSAIDSRPLAHVRC
jgi:hypothetical protein